MADKEKSRIITPGNGRGPKVVGIDNMPLRTDEAPDPEIVKLKSQISALREMADKLEDGTLQPPDFILVLPRFHSGDMPLMIFGDPMPTIMLEGILHKLVTRMAMQ